MSNFIRITPFLHVDDVEAAARFFEEMLGFTVYISAPTYAYVQRETAGIRIMQSSQAPGEQVPRGNRRFMYYIEVEDVGSVHAELKPKFEAAGVALKEPVDQRYGQRELMVLAPDGNLIVFGQEMSGPISQPPA